MKPQLTTNANELIKRVEAKLSAPFSEKCTLFFSVFPSLGTDHFSIQLIEEDQPFLITRRWIWNQDSSYPLGVHIYDLNNITIEERKILLSKNDYSLISEIKTLEIIVGELNGIMLDGEYFRLTIGEREFNWRMMHQISPEVQKSLTRLMNLAGLDH